MPASITSLKCRPRFTSDAHVSLIARPTRHASRRQAGEHTCLSLPAAAQWVAHPAVRAPEPLAAEECSEPSKTPHSWSHEGKGTPLQQEDQGPAGWREVGASGVQRVHLTCIAATTHASSAPNPMHKGTGILQRRGVRWGGGAQEYRGRRLTAPQPSPHESQLAQHEGWGPSTCGGSNCTIHCTSGMSNPRAATSVQSRTPAW